MADKLIVKNFGPIIDAELDIKKTTIFIGPQGSGKSTLAKLMAVFRDNITVDLEHIENSDRLTNRFRHFNLKNYFKPNTSICFSSEKYQINYDNSTYSKKIGAPFIDDITFLSKMPLYIPAERMFYSTISDSLLGLLDSDVALPKFFTSFGNEFEKARKEFLSFRISFLGNIEYKYENGQNLVSTRDGNFILLSESASGIQTVVPLIVTVIYFNFLTEDLLSPPKTFIIEEPELNLYPTTQKGLIYSLANRYTKGNNELLMTTHSPYILAALNNLIFAFKTALKHPDKADEIAKIVPRESWLNPDEFAAYFVADGGARSIINPKTGMIAENELDGVSEDFKIEFDELVEIYRLPVHETVY